MDRASSSLLDPRLDPRRGRIGGDLWILAAVLTLEGALLGLGLGGRAPLAATALALGVLYLLLAVRSPEIAWGLAFAATPFSVEVLLPIGGAITVPTEPMVALALLGWLARCLIGGGLRLQASPLHRPLGVLAATALVSVLLCSHAGVGLKAWVVTGAYAAFGYLYVVTTPCDAARRERWVRLAAWVGAAWGLYGAARVLVLGVSLRSAYGAARPFFTEHGTYAAFVSMLLPVALFEALERRGRARVGFAAAAFAMLLGVTFSFTRAAWLSLIVVLPLALGLWARTRRSVRRLGLPAALVAATAIAIFSFGVGGRLARHAGTAVEAENVSNLERVNRWMAAWEMTKDHPWLGVGYGTYPDVYPSYRRKLIVTELAYRHMGVHSEPLRLLSETGVLGLLAGLWFLVVAGVAGVRSFRRAQDPAEGRLALGVTAGLATYAVHGLFNSYLGIDKVTLPFWLGLGVLASMSGRARHR